MSTSTMSPAPGTRIVPHDRDSDSDAGAGSVAGSPIPAPEDAQAFYDACRFRFEQQEGERGRFSARVQQLVVVLTGLGGGAVYLSDIILANASAPAWARVAAWSVLALQLAAIIAAVTFVIRLFWSADYKGLPDKMVYEQVRTEADYYHEKGARQGVVVPRKTVLLTQMAHGLLAVVDHNVTVDRRRQAHLDRSKIAGVAVVVLFGIGLLLSFVIKLSASPA